MQFFNQRNRKISNLTLLADSLGHSLREGVKLFSVDDEDSIATFVTESGKVVQGNYFFGDKLVFDNIVVESGDVFSDTERFDEANRNRVSSLIETIYTDDLVEASEAFNDIINSWGAQLKFNSTVDRLREQSESFNATFNIIDTKEFSRFLEVSENISKFLSENKEELSLNSEMLNAIRLSEIVSRSFNLERMTLDQLKESGRYEVDFGDNRGIYEMVCQQELVSREISESKKSFDSVWVSEPSISELSKMIFEQDDHKVLKALVEAVVEIPYLALVSKKQLSNTISKSLSILVEDVNYSKNDLKDFVSKIFEMKKPLKDMISNMLSEKYGVNINNLKEAPTFRTLLNTQSLIFEKLARLAPRGSVIKESLLDVSEMLKSKNGVQAIDVNNGLKYLFTESGFSEVYGDKIITEFTLSESLSDSKDDVDYILKNIYDQDIIEEEASAQTEVQPEPEEEEDVPAKEGSSVEDFMRQVKEIEDIIDADDQTEE